MGEPIVIFGTGDFARVAEVYFSQDSPHDVAAFTVHEAYLKERELRGRPVVPFERLEAAYPPERYRMFVAMGYSRVNRARAEVYEECKRRGYGMASYVSSRAIVGSDVRLGDNCFILESSVLQPFVTVGNNVVVWSGSTIAHDVEIGDHCFIAPRAAISSRVRIGDYAFIGINATIRNGVTIGPECVIGAGALILADTEARSVYRGAAAERCPVASHELRSL